MDTLADYLNRYFINLAQVASITRIPAAEVESLIAAKLAPAPSYVVTSDGKFVSCVFGGFDATNVPEGRYFHKAAHVWVSRGKEARDRLGIDAAREQLRSKFKANFTQA